MGIIKLLPARTLPLSFVLLIFNQAQANEIVGGDYYFTIGRTWCAGNPPGCGSKIGEWHAFYKTYGGRANIVIEIED